MQAWLREASLKRLNTVFQDKVDSAIESFQGNDIDVDELEDGGLSSIETQLLEEWATGVISGRHCMMALLEHRLKDSQDEDEKKRMFSVGCRPRPMEFEMLSSTVSLHKDFLCDSGYLHDQVFSKTPKSVFREALTTLKSKTMEKSVSSLSVDQINLALKQMKMEHLLGISGEDTAADDEDQSCSAGKASDTASTEPSMKGAIAFKTSIQIEMIRIHLRLLKRDDLQSRKKLEHLDLQIIDTPTLQCQLDKAIEDVIEEAEEMSGESLEAANLLLKPYVRQLSSLKASLTTQLRELEESRAYISLGVHKDASESTIKKAYHAKAIKLHPDKPGGDTAKFQQLQACYQEILSKRKSEVQPAAPDAKTSTESQSAREVLTAMGVSLDEIKLSADRCSKIAHLNIQLQKIVDKAVSKGTGISVDELVKLIKNGGKKKKKVTVDSCSPQLVAGYLDGVCDQLQLLASLAMKLPTCGFRYGLATAATPTFMKSVEVVMSGGLSLMKLISSLMTSDDQVVHSLKNVVDVSFLAQFSPSKSFVGVEMLQAAIKNAGIGVKLAAEKCVDAALSAANLFSIGQSIVEAGEVEAVAEAKREAAKQEREMEYCEEDRVFMAEKSRRDREEASRQAEAQYEAQRKKEEEEEKDIGSVEVLRVKIRSLQVQLRIQNVQALQNLNRETRVIQKQLQQQLKSILVDSSSSEISQEAPRKASSQYQSLRPSILSLIADFIDTACCSLREDLMIHEAPFLSICPLIEKHLGWLRVTALDSAVNSSRVDSNDPADDSDTPLSSTESHSVKLALLPDFRSKAVWLCSIVDSAGVQSIVSNELHSKLSETIMTQLKKKGHDDSVNQSISAEIHSFCQSILSGIGVIRLEVETNNL